MKWIELELGRVAEIEKQTDEVIRTYEALRRQQQAPKRTANVSQISRALDVLKNAIVARIAHLERFYHEHDLDSRAARFETVRLKLKRVLRENGVSLNEISAMGAMHSYNSPNTNNTTPQQQHHQQLQQSTPRSAVNEAIDQLPRGSDGKVTLRIHMTPEEYDELRTRRAAAQMLRKGAGKQSWEMAGQSPRTDASAQGMYTYHEVPYTEPRHKHEPKLAFGKSPSPSQGDVLHSGSRYVSQNPEVFARTARFPTAGDEWRGGARAVDPQRPFSAVSKRTNTSSSLGKVQPIGSHWR